MSISGHDEQAGLKFWCQKICFVILTQRHDQSIGFSCNCGSQIHWIFGGHLAKHTRVQDKNLLFQFFKNFKKTTLNLFVVSLGS